MLVPVSSPLAGLVPFLLIQLVMIRGALSARNVTVEDSDPGMNYFGLWNEGIGGTNGTQRLSSGAPLGVASYRFTGGTRLYFVAPKFNFPIKVNLRVDPASDIPVTTNVDLQDYEINAQDSIHPTKNSSIVAVLGLPGTKDTKHVVEISAGPNSLNVVMDQFIITMEDDETSVAAAPTNSTTFPIPSASPSPSPSPSPPPPPTPSPSSPSNNRSAQSSSQNDTGLPMATAAAIGAVSGVLALLLLLTLTWLYIRHRRRRRALDHKFTFHNATSRIDDALPFSPSVYSGTGGGGGGGGMAEAGNYAPRPFYGAYGAHVGSVSTAGSYPEAESVSVGGGAKARGGAVASRAATLVQEVDAPPQYSEVISPRGGALAGPASFPATRADSKSGR